MSRFTLPLLFLCVIFFAACINSKVTVPQNISVAGKRMAIGNIYTSNTKKLKEGVKVDTLCACIAKSMQDAFVPYLQQAGFTVVTIPITPAMDINEVMRIADSAGVDYVLSGSAEVEATEKYVFIERLSTTIIKLSKREFVLSSTLSGGIAIRPSKAAERLGKKIVRELKKSKSPTWAKSSGELVIMHTCICT